jgi:hypothetical protein
MNKSWRRQIIERYTAVKVLRVFRFEDVVDVARSVKAETSRHNESVWEILVREAKILRIGTFEDFEPAGISL